MYHHFIPGYPISLPIRGRLLLGARLDTHMFMSEYTDLSYLRSHDYNLRVLKLEQKPRIQAT